MRYLFFLPFVVCLACNKSYAQSQLLPTLTVVTDSGKANLRLQKLDVSISVTGNIATTTFDITFYNPFDRVLEGSFEFPLAEGQSVYRYALDINGKLREGVVVEKQQARVAYENTVRRGIDPGLVEKTKGNSYRTRIYPIPAKGTKRVVIGIEQAMQYVDEAMLYQLPVHSGMPVESLTVHAMVYNSRQPVLKGDTPRSFEFDSRDNDWTAAYARGNFAPDLEFSFAIPFGPESGVMSFTGRHKEDYYFYLALPLQQEYIEKKTPSAITVLWDISSSGENRNIEKELSFLENYLAQLNDATVTLVPFNNTRGKAETFRAGSGNSKALTDRIRSFRYDGGTRFAALDMEQVASSQVLLFTDGISTLGNKEWDTGKVPVAVINSSQQADHSYMKFIAHKTNGSYINLYATGVEEAVRSLVHTPLQLVGARYDNAEIGEVYSSVSNVNGSVSVAGLLRSTAAKITLDFGYGNTVVSSIDYTITRDENEDISTVPRSWALLKIDELEMQPKKNRDEITRTGKAFSVVTSNTSLLVLDRVEDYVQYEIEPPAELRRVYDSLVKERQAFAFEEKQLPIGKALGVMEALKKWYNTPFGKKIQEAPKIAKADRYTSRPPRLMANANREVAQQEQRAAPARGLAVADSAVPADYATMEVAGNARFEEKANGTFQANTHEWTGSDETVQPADIEVKEWKPNAEYLARMEKTAPAAFYTTYLVLKSTYKNQPSFYVDIAGFLYRRGDRTLALQVLSNIAELKLEDPELLRILAHQLEEWNEKELAIEILEGVLELRGENPQSWRDLALAHAGAGNYQQAADQLYHIFTHAWDGRFDPMISVTINEFNEIIGRFPHEVNTDAYDKRFICAMPVDVRIVISWSSDDSDIDLWVSDPLKEKCDYTFQLTRGGGRLSGDITQGFGPEEYCMRKAVAGDYVIEINYYGDHRQTLAGPVTVKAELFTHYGTSMQKKQTINLRLTSAKEVIRIGVLKFGNATIAGKQ